MLTSETSIGRPLSVLHLSDWDNAGGSSRVAYRLHTGLKRSGVRSRMLVGQKRTSDDDVAVIGGTRFAPIDRLCGRVVDRLDLQYLFYPSSVAMPRMRWAREADVIQVFNTHGGFFSHLALMPLSRRKPVVWFLQDMWAVTGHCAYAYGCDRWQSGCGSCPQLDEYPRLRRDTSAMLWRIKDWVYDRSPLTIVAPSRWLAQVARHSPLLNRFPIHVIPASLDTDVFRPIARNVARERFGLAPDRPVVLFSAPSMLVERKGARFLKDALERLAHDGARDLQVLLLGADSGDWWPDAPFPIVTPGHLKSDDVLAHAYSAADVMILPTLADNLPNGILESMACGVPAVAFDVGGVSDAVRHMETGYLARYRDAGDLADGVRLLLGDTALHARLAANARAVAANEYGLALQARRFITLYEELLAARRAAPVAVAV